MNVRIETCKVLDDSKTKIEHNNYEFSTKIRQKVFTMNSLRIEISPFDSNTQSIYQNWKLDNLNGISNKVWREYGRLAWLISPDLAISLYYK